ncbi:MAG: diguanylate phosphodiesterase metal dependent hydrolase domain containing protein [Anaerospora sp.]|jgi:EAL and modified HD-GYP domain-containing signal transduction protein|nr:diguanylate phosphodiesterase metal dependent hydrolase domain containing protein [Anaerospora sp.]
MKAFAARQPVFNRNEKVVAYKLLFRSEPRVAYDATEAEETAIRIMAGTKQIFVAFSCSLLQREDFITYLPRQAVIIEVAGIVEPSCEIVEVCKNLKRQGYTIALTEGEFFSKLPELIAIVDIVKVDFLAIPTDRQQWIAKEIGSRRIRLMAERVETRADFEQAAAWGYTYFEGSFFSKPKIILADSSTAKMAYLEMLQEINLPGFTYRRMEETIKSNAAFSKQLLKYVNGKTFDFRTPIDSVRHALILLGKKEVEKWLSILIIWEISRPISEEILILAIARARFGEIMALQMGLQSLSSEIFFMGLFYLIECMVNLPIENFIANLPVSSEEKSVVLGKDNNLGAILYLVISYEKGRWSQFSYYAAKCNINEKEVPSVYLQSLQWAEEIVVMINSNGDAG